MVLLVRGVRDSVIAELGPVIHIDSREVESAHNTVFEDSWDLVAAIQETQTTLGLRFQHYSEAIREGSSTLRGA